MSYLDDNHSSSVPSFSANNSDHLGEGNNARAMSMAQGSNAIQENVTKKKVGFSPLVVMNSQSQHDIEHYAESIVLVYVVAFVLILLVMHIAGQVPGQSLALKVASNLMQLIGEVIALVFCLRPALRFRREYIYLRRLVAQNDLSRNAEMLAVRRLYLAWSLLAIGMALCIGGGVIWTSYDIRMPSSQVPFPGLFDIGFVSCYPFFLLSTLLLNQDRRTGSERTRLALDAFAIIGSAFALSWFFILGPTIANLNDGFAQNFVALYFPVGDLFLITVATLSMFSPSSTDSLQTVFIRLCSGLAMLAIADSLLSYFSLSPAGFSTGTLQDVFWPLGMMLMGLAVVESSRIRGGQAKRGKAQTAPASQHMLGVASTRSARTFRFSMELRLIAPFVLDLVTCTILLTVIAPAGGPIAIQASLVALLLVLLVVGRQLLTLRENNLLRARLQEELKDSHRALRLKHQEAVTDAITGLPNHRAVMDRMAQAVSHSQKTNEPCAVLFIDLDHFKQVNDIWGHRAGDSILRQVAERLRAVIREEDFVGRYGGEEFAVVLLNSDVIGAALAAERIRFAVVSPACEWQVDEASEPVQIKITGSIGIAVFGEHGTTREMLIERADSAMYFAKRNGRNRACIADSEEMRAAQNETIPTQSTEIRTAQVLTAAATARDFETGEHAHRLVLLAEAVARYLRLPEEDLHLIRLGALLHDIGKIGIPDGILHKPGPLTADEWVIMRQHPEIGHQILSMAGGVSQALAIIVLAHHERYDGKGYPHGISGEAIPIAARILSVIDAFDAMVSRRPYKEPISMSEACDELRRCSGAQFDPQVVEAFCYVVEGQGALAV